MREQLFGAASAQCGEVLTELGPSSLGGREPSERRHHRTLQYCLLEQSFRQRRGHQDGDRDRARRLPEHRDALRIAAEGGDVALDPLEGRDLVQQTIVAGGMLGGLGRQHRVREEAKDPDTVVEADDDDSFGSQLRPVIQRVGG